MNSCYGTLPAPFPPGFIPFTFVIKTILCKIVAGFIPSCRPTLPCLFVPVHETAPNPMTVKISINATMNRPARSADHVVLP